MTRLTALAAGTAAPAVAPGALVLTHADHSILDRAIRVGQRLRYRGQRRWACWTNHVACVVDTDGTLVEMLGRGATVSPLAKYSDRDRIIVHTGLAPAQATEAVAYWQWLAQTREPYGWVSIALDALALLTGLPIGGAWAGRPVCSAAAAAGLGLDQWRACPASVLPADIAFHFDAHPALIAQAAAAAHLQGAPVPSNPITTIEADAKKLSVEAKAALGVAVGFGAGVEALLSAAGPLLPALHVPAADVAVLSAVAAAISGAITWLGAHGIKARKTAAK